MRKRDLIAALTAIPGDPEVQVQSSVADGPEIDADLDVLHAHEIRRVYLEEMPRGPRVFIEMVRNYDVDGNGVE